MTLQDEIKTQLIDQLNLEDLSIDDIDNEATLFGDGLGLDSIDALELIVLLDTHFGIKIADPEQGKEIFKSINTMAEFIEKNR